jgi:putative OPT family oligopeptide transporter
MLGRETIAEFTFKAVTTGVLLGIVFGAANAYLGLRVGLTVSASIPAAVLAVAVFKLLRLRGTILEANLAQTIGSASTSLTSGTIFTIPALFLWGMAPPYLQVVALALLGGVLGLAAMIPLRRLLIVQSAAELPYPEGTACAEVLRATAGGASGGAWIFRGMLVGAATKLVVAALFVLPASVEAPVPVLPKAVVAIELAAALLAVGFILGYRQSGVLVAGSVVSAFALTPLIAWIGAGLSTPLFPELERPIAEMTSGQIWSRYVRYIGAGAVATAGILTVARNMPTMVGAFTAVARGMRGARAAGDGTAPAAAATPPPTGAVANPDSDRDLPGGFVIGAVVLVVLVAALVPGVFAGGMGLGARLVCAAGVGVFGILFVTVAARIVGIVGVSSQPTSGITLVTLLGVATVFAACGWSDANARAAVLTVGTIVAVAASKAGDISQDLKTGYLVGATPAKQQFGQLIGASFACWAVAGTVLLLGRAYEFGSRDLAAPQALLMKTIIEGVLSGDLPWGLVLTGAGVTGAAMLCGVSGLAFAIGVYLPLATMLPIFVGGCVRARVERGRAGGKVEGSDPGVLAASGLVAGEGLAGVLVAGLVGLGAIPKSKPTLLHGVPGEIATLVAIAAVCAFLYAAGRSAAVRRPA